MKRVDWQAYTKGRIACRAVDGEVDEAENPYPEGSFEWEWWNRGWNSVEVEE